MLEQSAQSAAETINCCRLKKSCECRKKGNGKRFEKENEGSDSEFEGADHRMSAPACMMNLRSEAADAEDDAEDGSGTEEDEADAINTNKNEEDLKMNMQDLDVDGEDGGDDNDDEFDGIALVVPIADCFIFIYRNELRRSNGRTGQ